LSEHYANDPIIQWSIDTLWSTLLQPHGWTDTSKVDSCGCPIWEKPGGGSTGPKSATAHEGTCTIMENAEGHGALHLWTTDPPVELAGRSNVTKLQFYALMEHAGDETAAQVALGLAPDYAELWSSGHSDGGPDPYTRVVQINPPEPPPDDKVPGQEVHPLTVLAKRLSERTGVAIGQATKAVGVELVAPGAGGDGHVNHTKSHCEW
jgi:hypothetical protein